MITHVFNSSVVSGPETLAIPALQNLGEPVSVVFLAETRNGDKWEGPFRFAREHGLEVHKVAVRGRYDSRAFAELRETLDRIGPRIVHAHDVKASMYLLKAARLRPGFAAKLVSTHHGAAARQGIIRLYEEYYVRFILPRFDAVMAVCSSDKLSLTRRGLRPERVFVHLNGVDRPYVSPDTRARERAEIQARWRALEPRLPSDAVYLGAVARLSPEKRHDRMLNGLKVANESGRPCVLACFGNGALEAELKRQTRALGLEDSAFWLGYSKTISRELAGFDLLLCLSDGEGIPVNLLEAGWAGTPVLSTRVGGIPDLIDSPSVGYLVEKSWGDDEIGRVIARVAGDSAGREAVGRAYQERVVAGFSEKAWLDQLRATYAGL
jgi:glycosyltransferase involved in cell wall biosynthesis